MSPDNWSDEWVPFKSLVILTMTYSLEFGLVNAANRYLTAEPFRFQVAATGKQLKPRQLWVLQFVSPQGAGAAGPGEGAGQKLHLISALKRYLAADANGKVTCDQDKPGPQTFFLLHQYPDGKVLSLTQAQASYLSSVAYVRYYRAGILDKGLVGWVRRRAEGRKTMLKVASIGPQNYSAIDQMWASCFAYKCFLQLRGRNEGRIELDLQTSLLW